MLKNIFCMVGIYTTIASTWRAYEIIKYKKVISRNRDTVTAMIMAVVIYLIIQ